MLDDSSGLPNMQVNAKVKNMVNNGLRVSKTKNWSRKLKKDRCMTDGISIYKD